MLCNSALFSGVQNILVVRIVIELRVPQSSSFSSAPLWAGNCIHGPMGGRNDVMCDRGDGNLIGLSG